MGRLSDDVVTMNNLSGPLERVNRTMELEAVSIEIIGFTEWTKAQSAKSDTGSIHEASMRATWMAPLRLQ